jgi:hypothetical protein
MLGRSICSRCGKEITIDPTDYVWLPGEAVCLSCLSLDDIHAAYKIIQKKEAAVKEKMRLAKQEEVKSDKIIACCTSSYPPMSCNYQTIPVGACLSGCTYDGLCSFKRPQLPGVVTMKFRFENGQWVTE